jgi:hypothetical protein
MPTPNERRGRARPFPARSYVKLLHRKSPCEGPESAQLPQPLGRCGVMKATKRAMGLYLGLGSILAACGSGAAGGDSADRVEPYVWACVQTTCQKQADDCESSSRKLCDDCFDACSSPYQSDPALCASTCESICQSDCGSCSAPADQCAAHGVTFTPPPINPEIETEARGFMAQCVPGKSPDSSVQFMSRSFKHEYVDALRCTRAHQCNDTPECFVDEPSIGTVGHALCQRQKECGSPCPAPTADSDTAAYVDSLESSFRPALVAELWRCAGEHDCGVAQACWAALQPAVGIGAYPDAQ